MSEKNNKKITYSYRFAEYDSETADKMLFMRNALLVELICKKVIHESNNKSDSLQPGESSREASLQAAGQ